MLPRPRGSNGAMEPTATTLCQPQDLLARRIRASSLHSGDPAHHHRGQPSPFNTTINFPSDCPRGAMLQCALAFPSGKFQIIAKSREGKYSLGYSHGTRKKGKKILCLESGGRQGEAIRAKWLLVNSSSDCSRKPK